MSGSNITKEEMQVLEAAKAANSKYFDALIDAAGVMKNRRDKYSGSDPYDNFNILLTVMGIYFRNKYGIEIDLRDVFMYYHSQKFARLIVSGSKDFKDESGADTRRDGANYYLIDEGDMINED